MYVTIYCHSSLLPMPLLARIFKTKKPEHLSVPIAFCWVKASLWSSGQPWTQNHPAPVTRTLPLQAHITSSNLDEWVGPCKEATGQSQENNSCYRTEQVVKCSVSSVKSCCLKSWLFFEWIFTDNNWKIGWKIENWCSERWFLRFFVFPKSFFHEKYRSQDSRQLGTVNIPLHFIPGKKDSEFISAP